MPAALTWHVPAASAEAESPPAQKAYHLRQLPHRSLPGFGDNATPEAAAAAERAASVTLGPIKTPSQGKPRMLSALSIVVCWVHLMEGQC